MAKVKQVKPEAKTEAQIHRKKRRNQTRKQKHKDNKAAIETTRARVGNKANHITQARDRVPKRTQQKRGSRRAERATRNELKELQSLSTAPLSIADSSRNLDNEPAKVVSNNLPSDSELESEVAGEDRVEEDSADGPEEDWAESDRVLEGDGKAVHAMLAGLLSFKVPRMVKVSLLYGFVGLIEEGWTGRVRWDETLELSEEEITETTKLTARIKRLLRPFNDEIDLGNHACAETLRHLAREVSSGLAGEADDALRQLRSAQPETLSSRHSLKTTSTLVEGRQRDGNSQYPPITNTSTFTRMDALLAEAKAATRSRPMNEIHPVQEANCALPLFAKYDQDQLHARSSRPQQHQSSSVQRHQLAKRNHSPVLTTHKAPPTQKPPLFANKEQRQQLSTLGQPLQVNRHQHRSTSSFQHNNTVQRDPDPARKRYHDMFDESLPSFPEDDVVNHTKAGERSAGGNGEPARLLVKIKLRPKRAEGREASPGNGTRPRSA